MISNTEDVKKRTYYINKAIACINNDAWHRAIDMCNSAIMVDPEYNLAHEYKLLAEAKVHTFADLLLSGINITKLNSYPNFIRYGSKGLVQFVNEFKIHDMDFSQEKSIVGNSEEHENRFETVDKVDITRDNKHHRYDKLSGEIYDSAVDITGSDAEIIANHTDMDSILVDIKQISKPAQEPAPTKSKKAISFSPMKVVILVILLLIWIVLITATVAAIIKHKKSVGVAKVPEVTVETQSTETQSTETQSTESQSTETQSTEIQSTDNQYQDSKKLDDQVKEFSQFCNKEPDKVETKEGITVYSYYLEAGEESEFAIKSYEQYLINEKSFSSNKNGMMTEYSKDDNVIMEWMDDSKEKIVEYFISIPTNLVQ